LQKTCHCLARGSTGSPTMVRQAHQPWFDCAGEGIFLWQDFLFLAKEYRAKDGGLAHAETFCFCNHSKNPRRDFSLAGFFLPCQGIPSQGRRVSACRSILLLQSFKKSMDGFFECRRPTRDWRGGAAVAVGNGAGRVPRNPAKPVAQSSVRSN